MTDWNYGQYDTLNAVENYVDRGNSNWTEEFMDELKEYLKVK